MKSLALVILSILLGIQNVVAQKTALSSKELEINKSLIKTAKKTIKQFAPDFYKVCKISTITKRTEHKTGNKHDGKSYYEVKFFYKEQEAQKGYPSQSTVRIWEDTRKPFFIKTISMYGIDIDDDRYEKALKDKVKLKKDGTMYYIDSIGNKNIQKLPLDFSKYKFPLDN